MSFPRVEGFWRQGEGGDADVVFSTRVRLSRSLARIPYPFRQAAAQTARLWDELRRALGRPGAFGPWKEFYSETLTPLERHILSERRYLEHSSQVRGRGVFLSEDESLNVVVNDEDPLRLVGWSAGWDPAETWARVDRLDSALEESLPFAADPVHGYRNSSLKTSGPGIKASVLLHLPGADRGGVLDKVFSTAESQGFAVKGLWSDEENSLGNIYQISSPQPSLRSESQLLSHFSSLVDHVLTLERRAREILLLRQGSENRDRCKRAFGILRYAEILGTAEGVRWLSDLRFGISAGIIKGVALSRVDECLYLIQRGHTEWISGTEGRSADEFRARFVRQKLFDSRGGEHV